MTNRILRDKAILRGEDEPEPETNFSRYESSLPEDGGRFEKEKPRHIGAGDKYPMPPSDYPLSQHPELPDDYTDKVEEPTSMTYGQDLTRLPGAPLPENSLVSSQATSEDPVEASLPSPSGSSNFSKPRRF